MKEHFTIGELAKITGASKKAILYYEKIGLIKPASINHENGYRYYSPSQIPIVETIQFGSLLDIPLKDMSKFFDCHNAFNYTSFFEYAKNLAETKIHALQRGLSIIGHAQEEMTILEKNNYPNTSYERSFPKKVYLVSPISSDKSEVAIYRALNRLYEKAVSNDFEMLFERGVLYEYGAEGVKIFAFTEIMPIDDIQEHCKIIPAGKYQCSIVHGRQLDAYHELFTKFFDIKGNVFAVAVEIFADNLSDNQPMSEIRVIVNSDK